MLVVVEGGADGAVEAARRQAVTAGLELRDGWQPGAAPSLVACTGVVATEEQAAAAVLAAARGASVIVDARGPRVLLDRLCDDLRRLGSLDHRLPSSVAAADDGLDDEQRHLLLLLAEGLSLGDAAARLHLSRRTADRRLAAARRALGVRTTTEAVVAVQRQSQAAP
jgi:DNA-binding CsgD family transcriptional regulator